MAHEPIKGSDISTDSTEISRLAQYRTGLLDLIETHFVDYRDKKNLSPAELRHKEQKDAIDQKLLSEDGIQVDGFKMWFGRMGNMEGALNIQSGSHIVSYRWLGVGHNGPQIRVYTKEGECFVVKEGNGFVSVHELKEHTMTEWEQTALKIALIGLEKMKAIVEHAFSATEVDDIAGTTSTKVEKLIGSEQAE